MRVMTDTTLTRYASAAATLPPETVRRVMAQIESYSQHTDDAADALPFALISLADAAATGATLPLSVAVTVALTGARRQRERDSLTVPTVDVDAFTCAAEAGGYEVRPATREPSGPTLEDILPTLPSKDAALLSGVAALGVARVFADRVKSRRTLPNGTQVGDDMSAPIPLTRRALRVGDVATAVGAPAPHSRAASDALRATACVAWSGASLALGTAHAGEDITQRAVRAMRYITTDATALAAAYRRERDLVGGATPATSSPDTLRRLGWVAPVADIDSVSLTRSMPEPRKGAPSRSRKGLVTANTSTRYAGGVSEGAAHGALVAGVSTDAGVLAVAREGRAMAREDSAHAAHAARMDAGAGSCSRPLPLPTSALGTSGAHEWLCGCGAGSAPLVSVWAVPMDSPSAAPERQHRHALTQCASPAETHDSAGALTGHRCGCGRKRGALVRQQGEWCHRRRAS